ncbi:MAG: hypothetical protein WCV88_05755 [Patescibacteria group bacterium]|jgi:hypothetical protein
MFSVKNIVLFVAENHARFGNRAPFVIANACLAAEACDIGHGRFSDASLWTDVMETRLLADLFYGITVTDPLHMSLLLGTMKLDEEAVLTALFGDEARILELAIFMERHEDKSNMPMVVGRLLRAKGVEWKDHWLQMLL